MGAVEIGLGLALAVSLALAFVVWSMAAGIRKERKLWGELVAIQEDTINKLEAVARLATGTGRGKCVPARRRKRKGVRRMGKRLS